MTIEVIKGSKIQSSSVIRRSRGAKIERTRTRYGRNRRRRPGPCRLYTHDHEPRTGQEDETRNGFWGWIVTPLLLKQAWRPAQSTKTVRRSKIWNDKMKPIKVQGRKAQRMSTISTQRRYSSKKACSKVTARKLHRESQNEESSAGLLISSTGSKKKKKKKKRKEKLSKMCRIC